MARLLVTKEFERQFPDCMDKLREYFSQQFDAMPDYSDGISQYRVLGKGAPETVVLADVGWKIEGDSFSIMDVTYVEEKDCDF